MAFIVNRNQQIQQKGLAPKPHYSRVVALTTHVADEIGANQIVYTPVIGKSVWLLGVDVWLMNRSLAAVLDVYFYLMTGSGVPLRSGDMQAYWETIIPKYMQDLNRLEYIGPREHFSWQMDKYYVASERRFGMVLWNLSDTTECWATVTFRISEG